MQTNEYLEFLRKQEEVYGKFYDARRKIESEGVKAYSLSGKGGYLVAFRLAEGAARRLGEVSSYINSNFIPSVIYGEQNAHTTILDMSISDNFTPSKEVLGRLENCVSNALKNKSGSKDFSINYSN